MTPVGRRRRSSVRELVHRKRPREDCSRAVGTDVFLPSTL
ncbi:hypothetical protein HSB1_41150 [Halogranum salarium B-1]|uniref:Uncharacterized protein n=1 Tax=Halogranum salarium B-1 TaxID=1210908 RepID=J3ETG1_9EURY|nr:hypothetical protein HSB1_41150 [Halogranum salarium B-1]